MYKANPNLGIYLAEQALRARFTETNEERQNIIRFCGRAGNEKNLHKLAYRLQRLEINRMAVDTVLNGLSAERRQLMVMKYKKNEMLVKISMMLNVSIGQLNLWYRSILYEIRDMMMYRLTERDIFDRIKTLNMVHILDYRLKFLTEHPELCLTVNHEWLNSLETLRMKYRKLLNSMEDVDLHIGESKYYKTVGAKIRNPLKNTAEISDICGISPGNVSRHLKSYTDTVMEFVSAASDENLAIQAEFHDIDEYTAKH